MRLSLGFLGLPLVSRVKQGFPWVSGLSRGFFGVPRVSGGFLKLLGVSLGFLRIPVSGLSCNHIVEYFGHLSIKYINYLTPLLLFL